MNKARMTAVRKYSDAWYTATDSTTLSGNDLSGTGYDVHESVAAKYVPEIWSWPAVGVGPERRDNMRSLFRITVVNPKTEVAEEWGLVVAKDEETAKLKAVSRGAITGKIEDYDILAECVGDVRAKKDVQKVKVVKEDEE